MYRNGIVDNQYLSLQFHPCKSNTTAGAECYSQERRDERLEELAVVYYFQHQKFDKASYELETAIKLTETVDYVNINLQREININLSQHSLVLNGLLNFINPIQQKTIFITAQKSENEMPRKRTDALFTLNFNSLNEFIEYERTDYTIFQFIGDVGALYGTLYQICALVLTKLF